MVAEDDSPRSGHILSQARVLPVPPPPIMQGPHSLWADHGVVGVLLMPQVPFFQKTVIPCPTFTGAEHNCLVSNGHRFY